MRRGRDAAPVLDRIGISFLLMAIFPDLFREETPGSPFDESDGTPEPKQGKVGRKHHVVLILFLLPFNRPTSPVCSSVSITACRAGGGHSLLRKKGGKLIRSILAHVHA